MKKKELEKGLHDALQAIAGISVAGDGGKHRRRNDGFDWREWQEVARDLLRKYPDYYKGQEGLYLLRQNVTPTKGKSITSD